MTVKELLALPKPQKAQILQTLIADSESYRSGERVVLRGRTR